MRGRAEITPPKELPPATDRQIAAIGRDDARRAERLAAAAAEMKVRDPMRDWTVPVTRSVLRRARAVEQQQNPPLSWLYHDDPRAYADHGSPGLPINTIREYG